MKTEQAEQQILKKVSDLLLAHVNNLLGHIREHNARTIDAFADQWQQRCLSNPLSSLLSSASSADVKRGAVYGEIASIDPERYSLWESFNDQAGESAACIASIDPERCSLRESFIIQAHLSLSEDCVPKTLGEILVSAVAECYRMATMMINLDCIVDPFDPVSISVEKEMCSHGLDPWIYLFSKLKDIEAEGFHAALRSVRAHALNIVIPKPGEAGAPPGPLNSGMVKHLSGLDADRLILGDMIADALPVLIERTIIGAIQYDIPAAVQLHRRQILNLWKDDKAVSKRNNC
jgi:hypothetical protein